MSTGWEEVWVTFVEDDESLINALVLAKSLRRTYTHRKLLAIHGPEVSKMARKQLVYNFDGILNIGQGIVNPNENDLETRAKIHLWAIPFCRKFVFLKSDSVVLENCDELFNQTGMIAAGRSSSNEIDTSILFLSTSQAIYDEIIDHLVTRTSDKSINVRKEFDKYIDGQTGLAYFDRRFTTTIDSSFATEIHEGVQSPAIVRFIDKSPLPFSGTFSVIQNQHWLEQNFREFWNSLYEEVKCETTTNQLVLHNQLKTFKTEPIAIVGMSCRLPGANNVEEFWNLIINKRDGIRPLPEDRWLPDQGCYVKEDRRNIQAGWLSCPIDQFDGKFFGISPMELTFTDPQHRFLLEVSYEALEDAAIDISGLQGNKLGIFTGIWIHDYEDLLIENGYRENDFFRTYMGNAFGTAAGRIAHFLEATGPNVCTESGCSSSMVAVGLACDSLRKYTSNVALACGVNLLTHTYKYSDLKNLISEDGHCKTFDAAADGFGRAEGCASLVLKRHSDAIRDNDRVYALIQGYGAAQEGPSSSMGTPTVECETIAMQLALKEANIHPSEVHFVETHGTGTAVGDPLEIKAITKVYSKDRITPLIIGSVKTNVGHTESCSGITGIIKTVLALQNQIIPPHRCLTNLNPLIHLNNIPAVIPMDAIPWKRHLKQKRYAGVSSFGITGTDAHVIIEEAPIIKKKFELRDTNTCLKMPLNILPLSAKSKDALDELVQKYQLHLEKNVLQINDLVYTASVGRTHFNHRVAITGANCKQIIENIQKNSFESGVYSGEKLKVCFLFTGQGSQYFGMGKTLYDSQPVFRSHFNLCDSTVKKLFQISIQDALWGVDDGKIHESLYSQISIFIIEYCLTKLWESWGIKPDSVLGHSLGEFAAATAAGILNIHDALKLVGTRSKLIDRLNRGKMLVVKANSDATKHLLKIFEASTKDQFWLDFAAINSPEQTTLAGPTESVEAFKVFCSNNEIKTHVLDATHAFHSREMEPILYEYRQTAKLIKYNQSTCHFISGVNGQLFENEEMLDAEYWVRHTRDAVQFINASKVACNTGAKIFLEIGPHPVLSALIKRNSEEVKLTDPIICRPSMRQKSDELATLLDTLAQLYVKGLHINWDGFYKFHSKQKISLPSYPFQRKKHWFNPEKNLTNILTQSGKQIHPLLGLKVSSPTETTVFQKIFNLNGFSYFVDHKVGDHVIFAGACYAEMALAFGISILFPETEEFTSGKSIVIKDLFIKSPFEMIDGLTYELQSVISSDTAENNTENQSTYSKINIYSRRRGTCTSDGHAWTCHSEAKFSSDTFSTSTLVSNQKDLERIQKRICNSEQDDFYSHLKTLGYEFGPAFQTIRNLWKNETEVLSEVNLNNNTSLELPEYFCHPTLLDAMIQTSLVASVENLGALLLPISIKRFQWIKKPVSDINFFVHVFQNEGESVKTAVLYDAYGNKLAIMNGLQFAQTTLEGFERSLGSKKFIQMFIEKWKPVSTEGPSVDLKSLNLPSLESGLNSSLNVNKNASAEVKEKLLLDKTITLVIIESLQSLGWGITESTKNAITVQQLMKQLCIKESSYYILRRFLQILEEDKFVTLQPDLTNTDFYIEKKTDFPSIEDVQIQISQNLSSTTPKVFQKEWQIVSLILENLSNILTGVTSADSVLFPNTQTAFPTQEILEESYLFQNSISYLVKCLEYLLENYFKEATKGRALKILEINAGNGQLAKEVLPLFKKYGVHFTYDFTDPDQSVVNASKTKFNDFRSSMTFKQLNIEDDPKCHGFIPHHYDIIISSNVIYSAKNLEISCRNIRHLLKNLGILLTSEIFSPQRFLDISLGLSETYLQNKNVHPPTHCVSVTSETEWNELLLSTDFQSTITQNLNGLGVILSQASKAYAQYKLTPMSNSSQIMNSTAKVWLILSDETEISKSLEKKLRLADKIVFNIRNSTKYERNGRKRLEFGIQIDSKKDMESVFRVLKAEYSKNVMEGVIYLLGTKSSNTNLNSESLTRNFLNLLQTIIAADYNQPPKLYLITEGLILNEGLEPQALQSAPLLGMFRSFRSENPSIFCKSIDLEPENNSKIKASQIMSELWKDDREPFVAYLKQIRHVARLQTSQAASAFAPLTLPKSERFSLVLPTSKSIADLKYGSCQKNKLQENEVEVQIKAAGLNFKDVFNVLKPTSEFDNSNSVGADFAGVITAIGRNVKNRNIGEAVIGCNLIGDALPSHTNLPSDQLVKLPRHMTFAEGATLPCVFATAYHCLVDVANLTAGETILIHTASGGVGLCAIQIARNVGANIIVTAGNQRKRDYLKSLGIQHVFNSRDITFGEGVKVATDSKGVQVVLNSITGPGFKETSLECCSPNARFVEMSKLNIWSPEQVSLIRPDVKYSIEDLSAPNPDRWRRLMEILYTWLISKKLKPLPYTRFDSLNIKEALQYLEKAKQIGKVVCISPEVYKSNNLTEVHFCPLFNDRSTYLITGGLRGIGLQVASWMVNSGAKHIVLAARSQPTEEGLNMIKSLTDLGANIVVCQADIGSYEQCKELINSIKCPTSNLPPLRGIMHSAGCLSDAVIANQTWEKFQTTMNPKVHGGWNLHLLTKELPLEHFVMFSSVVAVIGSPGQSNHAASNSYLDCLAKYRNSLGLPATSINWGQWGETGIAADKKIVGFTPFSTAQGIRALEHVMRSNLTQIVVCDGDISIWKNLFPWAKSYFEELKTKSGQNNAETKKLAISPEEFWKELLKTTDSEIEKRYDTVQRYLSQILAVALKYEGNEKFEKNHEFQELGMDSLMLIEYRNQIQNLLGTQVIFTANDMAECHTLHLLTEKVIQLTSANKPTAVDKIALREARNQLIREDAILWPHIIQGDGIAVKPSEVKVILLTGATGFLGPYMLRNLTQRANIQKVYCLLRENKKCSTLKRLKDKLKQMELLEQINMKKVFVIKGDISEVAMGVTSDLYDSLASEVDAVINCAVYANHLELYRKTDSKYTNLRAVNVTGTQRVLEFAVAKRTKLIYHASTFLAMWKAEDDTLPEDFPKVDEFDTAPNFGYAISKFLADVLIGKATMERNIPCKAFRFPKIAGDSKTGFQFVKENHFFMKFLQYIKSELMPSFEIPMQIIPVDVCADISLQIFFNDDVPSGMYNVCNPHSENEKQISEIAKDFGHSITNVEYGDFVKNLQKEGDSSLLYNWIEFYTKDDSVFRLHANGQIPIQVIQVWLANPENFFSEGKINKIIPNLKDIIERPLDILRRDVKFANENVDGINL